MPRVVTLEITESTQYATLYLDGAPAATFQRRRVYAQGPAWRVFTPNGAELLTFARSLPAATMARRAVSTLDAIQGVGNV